jgi:hypothetical protein
VRLIKRRGTFYGFHLLARFTLPSRSISSRNLTVSALTLAQELRVRSDTDFKFAELTLAKGFHSAAHANTANVVIMDGFPRIAATTAENFAAAAAVITPRQKVKIMSAFGAVNTLFLLPLDVAFADWLEVGEQRLECFLNTGVVIGLLNFRGRAAANFVSHFVLFLCVRVFWCSFDC